MSRHCVLGYAIDIANIHIGVSRTIGLQVIQDHWRGNGILRSVCAVEVIAPASEMNRI
jgi:hypothetical protein